MKPHHFDDIAKTLRWYARWKRHTLGRAGPAIIKAATKGRSLRELSRMSGLSPTYLSLVNNGKQRISPAAFVTLAGIVSKGYDADTPSAQDAPRSLQGAGAGSPAGSRRRPTGDKP